jgi:hypothetical protein
MLIARMPTQMRVSLAAPTLPQVHALTYYEPRSWPEYEPESSAPIGRRWTG